MNREIQSIAIIDEICINNIMVDVFGTPLPYSEPKTIHCSKVEIVFADGSIIETFLHKRECGTPLNSCTGMYNFTGVITEDGAENKCSMCDNVIIGPIYIDQKALLLLAQKVQNEQKTSS